MPCDGAAVACSRAQQGGEIGAVLVRFDFRCKIPAVASPQTERWWNSNNHVAEDAQPVNPCASSGTQTRQGTQQLNNLSRPNRSVTHQCRQTSTRRPPADDCPGNFRELGQQGSELVQSHFLSSDSLFHKERRKLHERTKPNPLPVVGLARC